MGEQTDPIRGGNQVMQRFAATLPMLLACCAGLAFGQAGELEVEIYEPSSGSLLTGGLESVEVTGGASVFGGVRFLDIFLVLDTSKSLRGTDPDNYRTQGAIALVKSLPAKQEIRVGVVDFDEQAQLIAPLSADRAASVAALQSLDRNGLTDLAAGIRTGLSGFDVTRREDSTTVLLLFTDGESNAKKAYAAASEARDQRVVVHTLLLGSSKKGTAILREVAERTGGSFIRVSDPAELPDAFLNLRTTGVDRVTLRANGSTTEARLLGGTFSGQVPLMPGENRIVATATSLAGETREDEVTVFVSSPLALAIESPAHGTLYMHPEAETLVEGRATLFTDLPAKIGAYAPDAPRLDRSQGVRSVVLRVDDSPPFATVLSDGRFSGRVLLHEGENRIIASATADDGRRVEKTIRVTVRSPGCAELQVTARRDGEPALSISDRSVEILFDASGSMWGQLDGQPKVSIAKQTLEDALDWLPPDLMLALRVYGHQYGRELRNCTDSELLVPFGSRNRDRIRAAVAKFKPKGQTPLAYSLERVRSDFGQLGGERAVILVTDGIESCGGDPVVAARDLQDRGRLPVHVIGFGLGGDGVDPASLRAIADASGGRFLTAGSAEELRAALMGMVGTPFRVFLGEQVVAEGTLGITDRIRLPAGDYRVHLESAPPRDVPVHLTSEEETTLLLKRERGSVSYEQLRQPVDYTPCRAGDRPRG